MLEAPTDVPHVLRRNPNHDTPYGVCSDDAAKWPVPGQSGIH